MNNGVGPHITQLQYKGKQIKTNEGMANTFNDFFTNIGPQLDKEIPLSKRAGGCKIHLICRILNSFLASTTNPQEVSDIINTLDDSKSSGPCSVPIKMLEVARHILSIPLNDICNTSFIQ